MEEKATEVPATTLVRTPKGAYPACDLHATEWPRVAHLEFLLPAGYVVASPRFVLRKDGTHTLTVGYWYGAGRGLGTTFGSIWSRAWSGDGYNGAWRVDDQVAVFPNVTSAKAAIRRGYNGASPERLVVVTAAQAVTYDRARLEQGPAMPNVVTWNVSAKVAALLEGKVLATPELVTQGAVKVYAYRTSRPMAADAAGHLLDLADEGRSPSLCLRAASAIAKALAFP